MPQLLCPARDASGYLQQEQRWFVPAGRPGVQRAFSSLVSRESVRRYAAAAVDSDFVESHHRFAPRRSVDLAHARQLRGTGCLEILRLPVRAATSRAPVSVCRAYAPRRPRIATSLLTNQTSGVCRDFVPAVHSAVTRRSALAGL